MNNKPQVTTNTLIHRLRLMADSGGMLSRDRIRTIRDAADRLEQLDERVAIMTEYAPGTDPSFLLHENGNKLKGVD